MSKSITWAVLILGASTLVSRIFGLLRMGLIADYFGRGEQADIYFAAFRIPDFVYNILIAGGVIIAFLPLFSEYYLKDKASAWRFVNNILNVFLFLLIVLSICLFIFTPYLVKLLAPGFSSYAKSATVALTRLMFLSPIFFGLSSIFSGILHYFHRFLIYSLAPIFYNLGIIFGILFLSPRYGIFGVGMGVVLGAFCHLLVQVPAAVKSGFRYRFIFNFRTSSIKRVFRLVLPRMFAAGTQQINLMVITAIASTITTGALAIFTYAQDLHYFPIGIFAMPFALVSFPMLSRAWAQGKKQEFFAKFFSVLRKVLFLIIPASVLIFILRTEIVRLILGTLGKGRFDQVAVQLTASCLGIFSFGLFASALIPLLARAFFALQDTKTPTLIAIASVCLNIFLSFFFIYLLSDRGEMAILGLPLAFTLAVIFQFLLLLFFLLKSREFKSTMKGA